ncbi:MAG: TlpA disulfide reductase family protein [Crocinitomicaceae bacterium]|nr:TlpA disulfide reductase family protein [Crocinitomicaceae bacterium]
MSAFINKSIKRLGVNSYIIIFLFIGQSYAFGQNIPSVQMESIDGTRVHSEEVFPLGRPTLLVFWATWCNHTTTGLSNIQDDYLDEWQEEFDLNIVAVSVDDAKTYNRAVSVANSNGWDFDIYLDKNGDFKRAMGVNNAPHVVLINAEREVVWQQPAFMNGDEDIIQEELEKFQ